MLEHGNWSGSLAAGGYRVAILAGEVDLSGNATAALAQWVQSGGTALLFASQLHGASSAAVEQLVGARLQWGGPQPLPAQIDTVVDLEDGWRHNRSAPAPSPFNPPPPPQRNGTQPAPFCVPANKAWYIKTGGNASVREGWDGGHTIDKCCRVSRQSAAGTTRYGGTCMWFDTAAACTAALAKPNQCLPCQPGAAVNIGCPAWRRTPLHPTVPNATLVDRMGTATVMIAGESAQESHHAPMPMVLRNSLGRGVVLTVLLEDAPALAEFGVLSHLLGRLAADLLPFEVLSATGAFAPKLR